MTGPARVGIPQLDRLFGPVPAGAAVALVNDPGVEAEPFLYHVAHAHLTAGATVVYGVFHRPPSGVRRAMAEYGLDARAGPGRLVFLDAHSPLMGGSEGAEYVPREPRDLDAVTALLERAATEHPDAVVVLDTVTALADHGSLEAFRARLPRLLSALRRFPLAVALLTRWPYDQDVRAAVDGFDAVVSLRAAEDRLVVGQYFTVEKAAWAPDLRRRPVLYRALRPGGVHVYVPKIVVTGAYHAGKSTLIHSLAGNAVSVNRLGTTVAMDHGRVVLDGLTADVFGTPGQARFDPILRTIAAQALGVVLAVDSTAPDTFPRAREMVQQTWRQGLPLVVAATKQDVDGALAPEEVGKRLDLPPRVQVVGCVAHDRASALAVLRALLDQVLGSGATP